MTFWHGNCNRLPTQDCIAQSVQHPSAFPYSSLPVRTANTLAVDLDTTVIDQQPAGKDAATSYRRPATLRRDLRASLADGATYSLMVGVGETYLPAFVLVLGMGDIAAGLIATVPMLLGALLQLVSPWAVVRLGSHRRWVVACARTQAASLLLLPIAALAGKPLWWLVFAAATLYWAAGLATGPAWNTWIESIVPGRIRARFFAGRVRISQICVLAGFLLGGVLLQTSKGHLGPAVVFSFLFAAAALARFLSAECLAGQSEPRSGNVIQQQLGLRQLAGRRSKSSGSQLMVYLLVIQSAVFIAGPFFTPFMLSELHLSYLEYTLLIAVGFMGKVIALPMWGRFARRYGAWRLLWIGGLGIIPLSALWLLSQSLAFLALLQVIGGIVWAAHELAMFLLFIEAIPKHERTSVLTIYNLGNAAAMVLGGVAGAFLLKTLGESQSTYLTLFALSAVARLATVGLLARVPRPADGSVTASTRTIAVRESSGSIEQPILASVPETEGV